MSLFEDLNRFFEEKLDEFLRNNPHIEINTIIQELKEQERDTLKKIISLESQEKQLQQQILNLAQDIQTWHLRVQKAQKAGEPELAQQAAAREASLLQEGNIIWQQMEGIKKQISENKKLLQRIEEQKKEAEIKAQNIAQENQGKNTYQYNYTNEQTSKFYNRYNDPLEKIFQEWETNYELEQMKRNLQN